MKNIHFLILSFALFAQSSQAFDGFGFLPYTREHMDIGVRLVDDELVGYWLNDLAVINGEITSPNFDANEVRALGIFDADTPPLDRPDSSDWDFLGVEAGEPIYILPSGGVPDTVPYLGFTTEDPSLSELEANQYSFTLVDMTAPEDGVFSLFVGSANVPLNTSTGFPAGTLNINVGDHLHYNWGFSHLGTYDLYFEVEAQFVTNSVTNVIMTGSDMFRFQITDGGGFDSYEHWRRTVFTPEDIADETISGPSATPLDDGISNLQRYAFGDTGSAELIWLEHNGSLVPGIEARMRFLSGDLAPVAEFTPQLVDPDWSDASLSLIHAEQIHHDPGMEIRTYAVDHPESEAGFLRLRSAP